MRTNTWTNATLGIGLLAAACGGGPASGSVATVIDDGVPRPRPPMQTTASTRPRRCRRGRRLHDAADDAAAEEDAADTAMGTRIDMRG